VVEFSAEVTLAVSVAAHAVPYKEELAMTTAESRERNLREGGNCMPHKVRG
jgi:hypothetical protein